MAYGALNGVILLVCYEILVPSLKFSLFYADALIFVEWPAAAVCRASKLQTGGLAAESSKASERGGGGACPKEAETHRGAELEELVI